MCRQANGRGPMLGNGEGEYEELAGEEGWGRGRRGGGHLVGRDGGVGDAEAAHGACQRTEYNQINRIIDR